MIRTYIQGQLTEIGNMLILLWEIVYWTFRKFPNSKNLFFQFNEAGVKSFSVVLLTSVTTGMVMALQFGLVMQRWLGYPIFVGMTVGFSMVKELSPILTAIVIAGRVGAAITAEVGTMKVTEQLDALHTLGEDPVRYLAVPRFIACAIMIPILTLFSMIISTLGGLLIANTVLDVPSTVYFNEIFDAMYINDVTHGIIKAFFFGIIVSWISVYKGFNCKGGAQGVGGATTSSVVTSIVLILVSDYFLSTMLINLNIGAGGTFFD